MRAAGQKFVTVPTAGETPAIQPAGGRRSGDHSFATGFPRLVREHLARDAAGIQAAILESLRARTNGQTQDDITLLVVKAE